MTSAEIKAVIAKLDRAQLAGVLAAVSERLLAEAPAPENHDNGAPILVDVEQLAKAVGYPKGWLLAQARQGKLPCVRRGKYVRFNVAEVVAKLHEAED